MQHRQIFYAFPVKPWFPERHHPVWCGSSAGHPEVHSAIPLPDEHTEWNWTRHSFLVVTHQLWAKITSMWWVSSLIRTLALASIRRHALWTPDLSWSSNAKAGPTEELCSMSRSHHIRPWVPPDNTVLLGSHYRCAFWLKMINSLYTSGLNGFLTLNTRLHPVAHAALRILLWERKPCASPASNPGYSYQLGWQ